MFRWLWMFKNQRQNFDDGSLRPHGRDFYEYIEPDGHVMTIEATLTGIGPIDRVLRTDFHRWKRPDDTEPVSEDKRREIIGKFKRYFDTRHITYEIE